MSPEDVDSDVKQKSAFPSSIKTQTTENKIYVDSTAALYICFLCIKSVALTFLDDI